MASRVQATKVGLSIGKQADIATANTNMVCFTKLNSSLAQETLGIESDAPEYGKGHEFASQAFTAGWDVNIPMEKYGTSQFAAWAWAFALGNCTGGYTITPLDPLAGLELPYFTYCEQIPGTDDDKLAIGCAIEEIRHSINSGPGRQNNRLQVTAVGSGKLTRPSGVTIPAPYAEVILPAGIAQVTINGTDYVLNKNLVSVEMGWKNNLLMREGFFPGSGFQTAGDATTGQIRGRIEIGSRVPTFTFVVRVDANSTEESKLSALTTGPATVSLPVSGTHSYSALWQKMLYKVVRRTDTNGIATVTVTGEPMQDATTGLVTITATTDLGGIAQ